MQLKHAGLLCATEENADTFYEDMLGLTKNPPKILSHDLAQAIFGVDTDLKMINYTNDDLHFEIFVYPQKHVASETIAHICLEVDDRKAFLHRCETMGIRTTIIPKANKTLVFVYDLDGNLFEIKEKESS